MCRYLYRSSLNPVEVTFTHRKPICTEQYERFFKSALIYNQKHDSFCFNLNEVNEPLIGSNPDLVVFLEKKLQSMLGSFKQNNIVERVTNILLTTNFDSHLTINIVARKLKIGERTLQRRLKDNNTSFARLLDERRMELAQSFLYEGKLSKSEISLILTATFFSSVTCLASSDPSSVLTFGFLIFLSASLTSSL